MGRFDADTEGALHPFDTTDQLNGFDLAQMLGDDRSRTVDIIYSTHHNTKGFPAAVSYDLAVRLNG